MHFGLTLDSSDIDLLDTDLALLDTEIPSKHVFFLTQRHFQDMCSRRVQDMSSA